MKMIDKHIESLAIPSLLIGLLISALLTKIPSISNWVSIVSGSCLALVLVYWVAIRVTNRLVPRRFANKIFALDEDGNLAIIFHPFYKRFQPPGSRLKFNESPHLAVERVMDEELGLRKGDFELISDDKELTKYGNTQIVPRPFLVESESGPHRLGVMEHYAFVYVCKVKGVTPQLSSDLNPRWMNLDELEELLKTDVLKAPWGDVIPTYQRVLKEYHC